jgi:predicted glycogen debranching enzyme
MELDAKAWCEWLEPDGLGGFASGTVCGVRTRRYHAVLLAALRPPTARAVLVNGFDAWVDCGSERFAVSTQRYRPDTLAPDGVRRLVDFEPLPWPRWTYQLADGARLVHELLVVPGAPRTLLSWRLVGQTRGAKLGVRLFLSGRDHHQLAHGADSMPVVLETGPELVTFGMPPGMPAVAVRTNGALTAAPETYRNFLYTEERERGLDDSEDLASPGIFTFDLERGEALMILQTGSWAPPDGPLEELFAWGRTSERQRRAAFASPLHRAADAYLVRRGQGRTVIAGYPWFTDWGRDTFIALRGLCLATGRLAEAEAILLEWAGAISEGMLPNRFPDEGEQPEFNSVDASLWFVIATDALLARATLPAARRRLLEEAVLALVSGYAAGTRYGIAADTDGLLRCGRPGTQLTWMDAKVGDWVVTPRLGKPVEVQALWLNALAIAARYEQRWSGVLARGRASFVGRFWMEERGHLADVVDCDHQSGAVDACLRPNQIYAVGGLPLVLLERGPARRLVDLVEERLWTPLGLRTLAPGEPGYQGRYDGGVRERDGAYHQGTAWPYLAGPFVEAWVRVRGASKAAKSEARRRFLSPLLAHAGGPGSGHLPEIADGDAPHAPHGCPFQAWSVAEALRLSEDVLA